MKMPVIQKQPQLQLGPEGPGNYSPSGENQNSNDPIFSNRDCREYSRGLRCPRRDFCPYTHNEMAQKAAKERKNAKLYAKSREKLQNDYIRVPSTADRSPLCKDTKKPILNMRQPLKQLNTDGHVPVKGSASLKQSTKQLPKTPGSKLQNANVTNSPKACGPRSDAHLKPLPDNLRQPSQQLEDIINLLTKDAHSVTQPLKKSKDPKKIGFCRKFITGECSRGKSCWYTHVMPENGTANTVTPETKNHDQTKIKRDLIKPEKDELDICTCQCSQEETSPIAVVSESLFKHSTESKKQQQVGNNLARGICDPKVCQSLRITCNDAKNKRAELQSTFCFDFANGKCSRGKYCRYLHIIPKNASDIKQQLIAGICWNFAAGRCTRNPCRYLHTAGNQIDKDDSTSPSSSADIPLGGNGRFKTAEMPPKESISMQSKKVAKFGNLDNSGYSLLCMDRSKVSLNRVQTSFNRARFTSSIETASKALAHRPAQTHPQQSSVAGSESVLVYSPAAKSNFARELHLKQAAHYSKVSPEEYMMQCNERTLATLKTKELPPIDPTVKTTTLSFNKWDPESFMEWAKRNFKPETFLKVMATNLTYIEQGRIPTSALTPDQAKTSEILAPTFSKLPTEIRILIWKFAAETELYSHHVEVVPTRLSDGTIGKRIRALTPPPSLLFVCKESEEQAKKHYKQSFSTGDPIRYAPFYFNFSMDRIFIRGCGNGASQLVDFASIAQPKERCHLRAIAIPLKYWVQGDKDAFLGALACFRHLNSVGVYIGDSIDDGRFASRVRTIKKEIKAIWLKKHPKRPAPQVYTETISALLARRWGIDDIKY